MTDLTSASVAQLLALNRGTLHELARREVIRTLNAPAGDWAELLVARAYGGTLAPNSEKSFDVTTPDGRRLQVKARVLESASKVGSKILSAIRSWDFDACVIVLFSTTNLGVLAAAEVDSDVLRASATFRKHTNSWAVRPGPSVMASGKDVSDLLRATAEKI